MEKLQQKYGFTNADITEIKNIMMKQITNSLPHIVEGMMPKLVEKLADCVILTENKVVAADISDDVIKAKASKFMKESFSYIKCELSGRNDKYYKYIRCTSLLDLYNDCLEDDALPSNDNSNRFYIPRKFREDNRHHMSSEEKRCIDKLAYHKMQNEMEILQIRRDRFRTEIREGDSQVKSYFQHSIENEKVRKEVGKLWSECIKQDELHIEEKWVKKTESLRSAFEKDKKEYTAQESKSTSNTSGTTDTSNTSHHSSRRRNEGSISNRTDINEANRNNTRDSSKNDSGRIHQTRKKTEHPHRRPLEQEYHQRRPLEQESWIHHHEQYHQPSLTFLTTISRQAK